MSTDLTIICYHRLRNTATVDGDDKNDAISCRCFNDGDVDIVDGDRCDVYDEYSVAAAAADDDGDDGDDDGLGWGWVVGVGDGWWWWWWGGVGYRCFQL